jgi:CRP-like cAMP-binding protein
MPELPKNVRIENKILAALPPSEYERVLPHLEMVRLPKGKVLYHVGDVIRHVYFINDGQVSLLPITSDGATVEVAMVGNEGVIGISAILRSNRVPYEVMVQFPVKSALRVRAEVVREEFNRGGKLQDLLLCYTQVLLTQITQSAICNRFHPSDKRLARWLLIANDLVKSNTFNLTHEFIAHRLGTPRTGVTMAAGALQRDDLIRYSRGKITIRNREGLEHASCECYEIIRRELNDFEKVVQLSPDNQSLSSSLMSISD